MTKIQQSTTLLHTAPADKRTVDGTGSTTSGAAKLQSVRSHTQDDQQASAKRSSPRAADEQDRKSMRVQIRALLDTGRGGEALAVAIDGVSRHILLDTAEILQAKLQADDATRSLAALGKSLSSLRDLMSELGRPELGATISMLEARLEGGKFSIADLSLQIDGREPALGEPRGTHTYIALRDPEDVSRAITTLADTMERTPGNLSTYDAVLQDLRQGQPVRLPKERLLELRNLVFNTETQKRLLAETTACVNSGAWSEAADLMGLCRRVGIEKPAVDAGRQRAMSILAALDDLNYAKAAELAAGDASLTPLREALVRVGEGSVVIAAAVLDGLESNGHATLADGMRNLNKVPPQDATALVLPLPQGGSSLCERLIDAGHKMLGADGVSAIRDYGKGREEWLEGSGDRTAYDAASIRIDEVLDPLLNGLRGDEDRAMLASGALKITTTKHSPASVRPIFAAALQLTRLQQSQLPSIGDSTQRGGTDSLHHRLEIGAGQRSTIFHEIAHILEFAHPELRDAAHHFVLHQATSTEPVLINTLLKTNVYGPHEVAFEGNFSHPYAGKSHRFGGRMGTTEILSMGVDYFANARAMAELGIKPHGLDHLCFTLGALKYLTDRTLRRTASGATATDAARSVASELARNGLLEEASMAQATIAASADSTTDDKRAERILAFAAGVVTGKGHISMLQVEGDASWNEWVSTSIKSSAFTLSDFSLRIDLPNAPKLNTPLFIKGETGELQLRIPLPYDSIKPMLERIDAVTVAQQWLPLLLAIEDLSSEPGRRVDGERKRELIALVVAARASGIDTPAKILATVRDLRAALPRGEALCQQIIDALSEHGNDSTYTEAARDITLQNALHEDGLQAAIDMCSQWGQEGSARHRLLARAFSASQRDGHASLTVPELDPPFFRLQKAEGAVVLSLI